MQDFTTSPFDAIRKTNEQGHEYWSARLRRFGGC
jgi:hypothetical protein